MCEPGVTNIVHIYIQETVRVDGKDQALSMQMLKRLGRWGGASKRLRRNPITEKRKENDILEAT